ncbi:MAG: hypothetical protein K0R83_63 [Caulobacter sp.]|nr:hypothetical protein [Caulobacter sp.]
MPGPRLPHRRRRLLKAAPDHLARYWTCGGEILALGGPLPMAERGARVLTPHDLARLAAWHRAELAAADPEVRRYHSLCLRDAEAALALSVANIS